MPAFSEILFIAILALVVIGPKQLPQVARTLGRFLNELRRATEGVMHEINKETRKIGDATGVNDIREGLKLPEMKMPELKVQKVSIDDLKPSNVNRQAQAASNTAEKKEENKPS